MLKTKDHVVVSKKKRKERGGRGGKEKEHFSLSAAMTTVKSAGL